MTDSEIRVVDTGITCLHSGGDSPKADLLFVHGLGGHPQKTWSAEPCEPKASAERGISIYKRIGSKLFSARSKKREKSGGQKVFWPRDLLPKNVEDVRVMTFGYYSNPVGPSQDNLYTLSTSLLSKLANERTDAPNRPIIFVVHNLGGILTKLALKMSQDSSGADSRLTAIRDSTRGVIFFGTPHSGSDMANWGELLRRIAGIFAVTNSTLLAALNPDSDNGQLEELSRNFARMLGPSSEGKFRVFSFREGMPLVNGPLGPAANLVVPLASSKIDSDWASFSTVPNNNRDICRFSGPKDPKYTDFVKELQRFLNEIGIEDQLRPREGGTAGLNVKKMQWLNTLYTCPYIDRKDLNPPRVEGTCEWFTSHPQFRNWQGSNTAGLLWVSADPGCGKSVLAKYLVDEELRSTNTRTTCYFFFKDGFDDQKSSTTALSCILRQIFKQSPGSFSDQILEKLEADGSVEGGRKKPPMSFHDLWDLFIAAATSHKGGEIVCILDALDECEDSGCKQLLDVLVRFYLGTTPRTPAVKFLLTSRPYSHIRAGLRDLERKVPTIYLSGENEERVGEIAREIDIVITKRVEGMRQLGEKEQAVLREELLRVENRTYLWVHLIFAEIEKGSLLSQGKIRSEVRKIPQSVDEAYGRILSKSRDTRLAKKLLHIVVAATRPLTLQEMALALAIQPTHRSWGDLEQELVPEEQFPQEARQLCGLFVVVVDKRIYLLHQTAREFLVPSLLSRPSVPPSPSSTVLRWKSSFHPGESNRILTEICMWRLSLSDFNRGSFHTSEKGRYIAERTFLGYAAQFWTDHFRNSDCENGDRVVEKALSYFNTQLPASLAWFEIYRTLGPNWAPTSFTPLVIASYFGLSTVVQQLLKGGADVNGRTPLHWASRNGHDTIVLQLLEAGADVNAKDRDGQTPLHRAPLHWASRNGHDTIVLQLLEAGADVNAKDIDGWTPLHWASMHGHDTIVLQLRKADADGNGDEI